MPWPKDHKSRTRTRIVQAAAAAFRAGGISGVRVEGVMARAGLTHGGFYAHFTSKDALLRESLDYAGNQTVGMLSTPLAEVPPERRLRAVIDAYLSPAHVTRPERGCPIASLGPEVARAGGATQRSLAKGVKKRIAWMRQLLPESQRGISENQVIATVACMIGGVVLARLVTGKDSAAVLDACREFLHRAFEESAEDARAARTKTRRRQAAATPKKRARGGHEGQ